MPVQTLNELKQLRDSWFGRPRPRHGLRLLFWLADDFINFQSNEMFATSNPKNGCFGFHWFYNRIDDVDDETPLLPQNLIYYEVGNLNEKNARNLPDYVTEQHTGRWDKSNSDRIILAMDDYRIHRVYVTQHSDNIHFSHSDTYRISQGLIRIIKRLDLAEFLKKVDEKEFTYVQSALSRDDSQTDWPYCKCMCIVMVVFIFAMIYVFWKSNNL